MRTPPTAGAVATLLAGLAFAVVPAASAVAAPTTPRPVAYVLASGLEAIDLQSHTITQVPGTPYATNILARPDGKFVYAASSTTLAIVDTSTSRVAKTIALAGDLEGMTMSPDGRKIYLGNWTGNSVSVLDTTTNTITATITNIPNPYRAAFSPDGRYLYVTNTDAATPVDGSGSITVLDTTNDTVTATIATPAQPFLITVSPDGGRAYVATGYGKMAVLDLTARTVLSTLDLGNWVTDEVITPDGKRVYLTVDQEVQVFNTTTGALMAPITIGDSPAGLTVSADGSQVLVARLGAARLSAIDTATDTLLGAGSDINTGAGPYDVVLTTVPTITGPAAHLTAASFPSSGVATVSADASASAGGFAAIVTYSFNFGDGTVLTQSTPKATHVYATAGTYTVKLTVTDGLGQTSQASAPVTVEIAVQTVALLASNLHYVTAENAGASPLVANRTQIGQWETFDVIPLGYYEVVLRSHANSAYIRVDGTRGSQLIADAQTIATATQFELAPDGAGQFLLRLSATNRYLSSNNGTQPMTADRSEVGPWEKFYLTDLTTPVTELRAKANGHVVTAEAAGAKPLIASRSTAGLWESFDVIDAGDGYVALLSHADNRFVTAENAGKNALIANRPSIGDWEKFTLLWNPDGTFSLLAHANGKYVTAENAGNSPLIANRTDIGDWEKFSNS